MGIGKLMKSICSCSRRRRRRWRSTESCRSNRTTQEVMTNEENLSTSERGADRSSRSNVNKKSKKEDKTEKALEELRDQVDTLICALTHLQESDQKKGFAERLWMDEANKLKTELDELRNERDNQGLHTEVSGGSPLSKQPPSKKKTKSEKAQKTSTDRGGSPSDRTAPRSKLDSFREVRNQMKAKARRSNRSIESQNTKDEEQIEELKKRIETMSKNVEKMKTGATVASPSAKTPDPKKQESKGTIETQESVREDKPTCTGSHTGNTIGTSSKKHHGVDRALTPRRKSKRSCSKTSGVSAGDKALLSSQPSTPKGPSSGTQKEDLRSKENSRNSKSEEQNEDDEVNVAMRAATAKPVPVDVRQLVKPGSRESAKLLISRTQEPENTARLLPSPVPHRKSLVDTTQSEANVAPVETQLRRENEIKV